MSYKRYGKKQDRNRSISILETHDRSKEYQRSIDCSLHTIDRLITIDRSMVHRTDFEFAEMVYECVCLDGNGTPVTYTQNMPTPVSTKTPWFGNPIRDRNGRIRKLGFANLPLNSAEIDDDDEEIGNADDDEDDGSKNPSKLFNC